MSTGYLGDGFSRFDWLISTAVAACNISSIELQGLKKNKPQTRLYMIKTAWLTFNIFVCSEFAWEARWLSWDRTKMCAAPTPTRQSTTQVGIFAAAARDSAEGKSRASLVATEQLKLTVHPGPLAASTESTTRSLRKKEEGKCFDENISLDYTFT